MVNVPKTQRTFCKKRGKRQRHEVTRIRRGRTPCMPRERGALIGSRVATVGRQPIFQKKAKTTKSVPRLECVEPKCRSGRMLAIKRCKHLNWEEIRERAK